jgi:benzoyl-CoA reductase/2-hydroxyglutaryl-CoA dehydratase subunit BcrC/BadD/HgdB
MAETGLQGEKPNLKEVQKKITAGASYRKILAAAKEGKPICVACAGIPSEVLFAMGVHPVFPESLAAISSGIGKADEFFDEARNRALSSSICSYTRCGLGITWSNKCGLGPLPEPDLFLSDISMCCLHVTWWTHLEDYLKKPTFYLDIPANDDPTDPDLIQYYEGQIHDMVEFVEANTDCRLDVEKLTESVTYSDLAGHYWRKILELRKHKPSPVSFRNLAGQILPLVTALGEKDTSDFYELLFYQCQEDIQQGKSPTKNGEKFRLIWDGIPIWHNLRVIPYFEDQGANFVWESYTSLNWGNKTKTGRLDLENPFNTLAEKYTNCFTNRSLESRFTFFDEAIREYDVDGLVMFANRSCRPMSIGQHQLIELVNERHGLPVLILEGDQADAEGFSWEDARNRIDGFIEILEARKK